MQGWTNDDRQAKERMISDHFPSKSVDSFKTQTQKKKGRGRGQRLHPRSCLSLTANQKKYMTSEH